MMSATAAAHGVTTAVAVSAANLDEIAGTGGGWRQRTHRHCHRWKHQAKPEKSCGRGRDDRSLHVIPSRRNTRAQQAMADGIVPRGAEMISWRAKKVRLDRSTPPCARHVSCDSISGGLLRCCYHHSPAGDEQLAENREVRHVR
jgi:hypothetical protein